ncbi:flagellar hook assembly protein FlgD [Pseudomonas sp. HR96]|uniref:flagellar hook assembly protein FlgD n=1 Tax=Pseudomonas sp. HR96 TaxID=1027966 RepID=UPI002A74EDF1|nr:flagellar hook assembly protein FlgD [Pseudomonas sp. HR96]WPP01283.1 flagellar hook assembly protein FlgD [Pseudomonas sp. HR96]
MSTTNSTSSVGSSVLAQLQASSTAASTPASTTGTTALGKDAFLQLLVTQMKNQNPLDPQDNTTFVSQLAQFSSVESLQNLNTSVGSITSSVASSQALQASSLVGRSVIAQTSTAVVDPAKGLSGSVAVTAASTDNTVKIYNSEGTLVRTMDLGASSAGTQSFTWNGLDDTGAAVTAGTYTFKASSAINGTATDMLTYLPATVNSVTMATASGGEMTLNLNGQGSVALSKVQSIGI